MGRTDKAKALKAREFGYLDRVRTSFERDPRWGELLGGRPLVMIDGGTAKGIMKEWHQAASLIRVIAVEPRDAKLEDYTGCEYLPIRAALDRTVGRRELIVLGAMTSFLRPSPEALNDFDELWRHYAHMEMTGLSVETTTLDALVEEHELQFVDFVKLDTQGSELYILQGGPRTVGELAFGFRIEVEFYPLYVGQPLFTDVDQHMRSHGLELIDLLQVRSFRTRLAEGQEDLTGASSGRLIHADALYFRPVEWLTARLRALEAVDRVRCLAGAVVVSAVYGKPDLAARYINDAGDLIGARERATMLDLVKARERV